MAVGDAYVLPGFLTPALIQLFFPKPPTTFLTCFCRGERRKYAGKKSRFNRGSNSQPPGHESDTLTSEPPGRGIFPNKPWFLHVYNASLLKTLWEKEILLVTRLFSFSHSVFYLFQELSAISTELKLSSAKSFNLDESKNLSFGKG